MHLDGVPLDLAGRLLPRRRLFRPSVFMHVYAHGRAQKRYAASGAQGDSTPRSISRHSLFALLDSLRLAVEGCKWRPAGTEWADYYDETNYSSDAMASKAVTVETFLTRLNPGVVWDLGANTGRFSRIASDRGAYVLAFDIDPAAVERAYLEGRSKGESRLLPLVMDLMDPTPRLGWNLRERESLLDRATPDVVFALALVHHLAIGQNVPLSRVAQFFAEVAPNLVVEFVPKSDSQVQRMLSSRRDIFDHYDRQGFEDAFAERFEFIETVPLEGADRILYLMRRR